MISFKSSSVTQNSLVAKMPEPPEAIAGLLDEYQEFLGSVFTREYRSQNYNPLGTAPIYMPKLTDEEKKQIEILTRKLHSAPEWKEYTQQCRRWAVLM